MIKGNMRALARLTTFEPRGAKIHPPVRTAKPEDRRDRNIPHEMQSKIASAMATPPRCLVLGSEAQSIDLDGFAKVVDPEQPFDVIVSLPVIDIRSFDAEFSTLIARSSNPVAPLIGRSTHDIARVDVRLTDVNPRSIGNAIASTAPIRSRLAMLPAIERGPHRNRLITLTLAASRDLGVAASWSPLRRAMIGYSLLAGLPNQRAMLEDMADQGLLRRRFFDRLYVCRHCSSSRLLAREVCCKCHSSDIEEQALLHHYPCGYQAAEEQFRVERSGYQCPKCSKQLRHYGLDYDKPGKVTRCNTCHEHHAEPDAHFVCTDCGLDQATDGAARQAWHHYDITSEGVAATRNGKLPGNADEVSGKPHRSLRDFHILSRQLLTLAAQHNRPIAALRMTIDAQDLNQKFGAQNLTEVQRFIQEIAIQALCESDIVTCVEGGIIACLPETSEADTATIVKHIRDAVDGAVSRPVALNFNTEQGREKAAALLQGAR